MENIIFEFKSLEKRILRRLFETINNKEDIIPPTQMQIIGYVLNNDKVYQKDLENVLNLRRATVSGVLQTMEKNGLIERQISSEDTRIKKIIIKEKAKKIYDISLNSMKDTETLIKKDISEDELELFIKVIHKMKNNLEEGK